MIQTLEDSLAAVEAMRKTDVQQFETMARNAANGEAIKPAELNRVMQATGQNADAFRRLVGVFSRRNQLRQNIVDVADSIEKQNELRAEIAEHNAELERHVAAHQAATRPIQFELQQLQQTVLQKAGGETELFQTCPNESLRRKYDGAMERMETSGRALAKERDSLERIEADVPRHEPGTYDFRLNAIRERIETHEQEREQAEADSIVAADAMRSY